jgi:hypothetical protein
VFGDNMGTSLGITEEVIARQPPKRKSKKKRGGQPGYEKHERPLIPTAQGDDMQPLRHQVWELPEIKPQVTEYQRHRLTCRCCGETTCAELPLGVPQGQSGPRLMALTAPLMAFYRQSKRRTAEFLSTLLGQPCCPSLTVKIQNQVTTALTAFLGEEFRGVVNCDRAKIYWRLGCLQWCWARLKRDFQAMIDGGDRRAKHLGWRLRRRSLRHAVIWRKLSFGTQSAAGSRFVETMLTIIETCRPGPQRPEFPSGVEPMPHEPRITSREDAATVFRQERSLGDDIQPGEQREPFVQHGAHHVRVPLGAEELQGQQASQGAGGGHRLGPGQAALADHAVKADGGQRRKKEKQAAEFAANGSRLQAQGPYIGTIGRREFAARGSSSWGPPQSASRFHRAYRKPRSKQHSPLMPTSLSLRRKAWKSHAANHAPRCALGVPPDACPRSPEFGT